MSAHAGKLEWDEEYHAYLGTFHGMWSTIDFCTDYAITRFLKVTDEQGHLITSGMMFGTKARLLMDLIHRSDHPNRGELLRSFGAIRGRSKRDIIVHGYQTFSVDKVGFVERARGGVYTVKQHVFTRDEFLDHVNKLIADGNAFQDALDATNADLHAFSEAAFNILNKSETSPADPSVSA